MNTYKQTVEIDECANAICVAIAYDDSNLYKEFASVEDAEVFIKKHNIDADIVYLDGN